MKIKYLVLLAVTGTIIALDQLTKHIITQRFHLGESIAVLENFFNLTYVRNPGAAFGIFSGLDSSYRIPFFIAVPIFALGVIFYIFRGIDDNNTKMSVALSLVIGGAFGNLIDRVAYNYVIDFLDFHWYYTKHFPAFNVADSAICVGVGFLILDLIQKERAQKKESSTDVSNPS